MGFSLGTITGAVVGGPIGALVGASADANKKNANAMREMSAAQLAAWEKANAQNREDLAPWTTMGRDATGRLTTLTSGSPEEVRNAMMVDPGYQWRVDQGQQALERGAAGKGNFFSGNTGIALQKYGQGMAMDEFDRTFSRLSGLSTQGLSATQSLTGSTNNVAQAGSDAAMNSMNAQISRNNFWPNMGMQALQFGAKVAPMMIGAGAGGAGAGAGAGEFGGAAGGTAIGGMGSSVGGNAMDFRY